MNWLARLIVESAEKEYSRLTKSFFMTWGFLLFEAIVPGILLLVALVVEMALGLDRLASVKVEIGIRLGVFLLMLAAGQGFIIWTAAHQLRFSGGTPAFKAPPKKLLVDGPFRYCRNPMVFGYLLYYYGLAFLFASPVDLLILCPALHLLALYVIVEVEEVELEERFGADYLTYKAKVNRMIPLPPAWRHQLRDQGV
ncbi:MAG: methyltransferase family protein [Acidobacteriota bacterium]